jgi:U6 snRNA-associated Sm-like protein LSm7
MAANGSSSGGARKDPILDLAKYIDQEVRVKFHGGREVTGVLKGYDQLVNLVLDDCIEFLRDPSDEYRLTDDTRKVGLVVCRGTSVMLVSPVDGTAEIPNPFLQQEE